MFTTALVGVDGGPGGSDAIALARQLAPRLVLAHVHSAERDGRKQALALLHDQALRAKLDEQAVSFAAIDGRPGSGLRELADRHGAPVVVVGSSQHHGLGRLVHGDDVRATFHAAQTAVAVAPAGWSAAGRPLRRIGVGWNGGRASAAALELARSLADGATVHVTEAVTVPERTPGMTGPDAYAAAWYPGTQKDVDQAQARLDALGLDGRAVSGFGTPVLADLADDLDLLVVGNEGHGPVWRVLVGDVAGDLARTLTCPLLVAAPVPGGLRSADAPGERL